MVQAPVAVSVPFPFAAGQFVREHGAGGWRLRRFGDAPDDLELNFGRPRPALITDVILACICTAGDERPGRARIDEMSVSARIVCLLLLVRLDGVERLTVQRRCPVSACGNVFEIDLGIDEALSFAPEAENATSALEVCGETVEVRSATGSDELAWLRLGFTDAAAAREAILRSLVLSPALVLPDAWLEAVEATLDEHDPLVSFRMDVVCPACGATGPQEVDLAGEALRLLRGTQARLLDSVHRLASRYGWSEQEVLALPRWRRDRYVALVTAGAS